MNIKKQITRGFTIVELLVVMVIIGILASITIVVYSGIQAKARDVSVLSDLDRMAGVQANYGLKHKTAGKAYYSLNGHDIDLAFDPSNGNVISVMVNATDYCIRGYNVNGTNNSIDNSLVKESTVGACALIAAINPPPTPALAVALNGVNVLATITPVTCSTGTIQYQIRGRTNDGSWGDYTAWSVATTATQAASEGVKYGYQAQTRCYVDEALISSSMLGSEVTYTATTTPPSAPTTVVTQNGGNILATITPVTCPAGTIQYGIRSRINDGSWTDYTDWSSTTTATQSASEGVKYGYQAQARCYVNGLLISSSSVGAEGTYTVPTTPPPAPAIAVTLNGGNILATITPVSCSGAGIIQYQIRSRTNDGGWGGYSAWSSTTTASQGASQGVKYGYQAQARCYVNDTSYSSSSTGAEGTYIMYLNAPAAPSVWNSVADWNSTNYYWGGSSCPSGAWVTYYYYYWRADGWNSGWIGTGGTSANYSTAHFGWWYNIQVAAQCSSNYTSSGWSGANSTSYSRPTPSIRVMVVAGGGGGGYEKGGGGGAGGVVYNGSKQIGNGGYGVTVGGGGAGESSGNPGGGDGGYSYFMDITTVGGGGGGSNTGNGRAGGSGGGGAGVSSGERPGGGVAQGSWGGQGYGMIGGVGGPRSGGPAGGGGGGATEKGQDYYNLNNTKQNGGAGITTDISGSNVVYAGGGGGGAQSYHGNGGAGGGGNGGQNSVCSPQSGVANTGGGGGGGQMGSGTVGGNGGSGIVIIRYYSEAWWYADGGSNAYWVGGDIVRVYNGGGTFNVYGW